MTLPELPPIPPEVWAEFLVLLRAGKTFEMRVHAHEGRVRGATFEYQIRVRVVDSLQ